MVIRIIFFFYYSTSNPFPEDCFLDLSPDIAYRNMFLKTCSNNKIHFEFPMFEDHSYNSICNGDDLIALLREPSECDKYLIFRTKNNVNNELDVVGYYRVGSAYYQETDLFNKNGFIWGFKADNVHLVKKGAIPYEGPPPGRGNPRSWSKNSKWKRILIDLLQEIKKHDNYADQYQSETNRLVDIFKDKVQDWKDHCSSCSKKGGCNFYRRSKLYKPDDPEHDLFFIMNKYYTEDHYSRNLLETIRKIPMRK